MTDRGCAQGVGPVTPAPADLRQLRETMAARGGPAAALAEALPDRLDGAALDALTPAIVRALRATIYGEPNAPTNGTYARVEV